MALADKKQQPSGGEMREKPEKIPPQKEEKKDTSLFREKTYVEQEKGRLWSKRGELFKTTGIPPSEMSGIWERITKGTDYLFERKEAEKIHKEIKDFPIRSREKYGIKSEGERLKILKLLEKSLGK